MELLKIHDCVRAENEVLKRQMKLMNPSLKNDEADKLKMEIIALNGKVNEKRKQLKDKK